MPGQIPQALGVLSKFLGEENLRLEREIKQDNIRKTIEQTSEQFASLGPDASQQDVRSLYYKSLQSATQNEAEETIPFITQMFSQSANFVREEKAERQGDEYSRRVEQMTGLEGLEELGPKYAGDVAGLDVRTTRFVTKEDEEGRATLNVFKFRDAQFKQFGDPIEIRSSTFAQRDKRRSGQFAPKGYQQGGIQWENTISGERGFAIFNPTTGLYEKQVGARREALTEFDVLNPKESPPSLERKRNTDDAVLQQEVYEKQMQLRSRNIARQLKDAGYDIATSEYQNLVSGKVHPGAYIKLFDERQQIADFITTMPAGAERDKLRHVFGQFTRAGRFYEQSSAELERHTGQSPFRDEPGIRAPEPEPVRQVNERVATGVDDIIAGGPQGPQANQYHKLAKRVQADLGYTMHLFLHKRDRGLLTFDEQLKWQTILFNIEDNLKD